MNVSAKMSDRVDTVTMTNPIRVAVINGDPIVCKRVVRMLNGVEGIEVVGEGATAADAIKVAKELRPDVVLLDLRLPRVSTEAAAGIARVCPNAGTIILMDFENEQDVGLALQAGTRDYVMTGKSIREVVETVRAIVRHETRVVPNIASRLLIRNGEQIRTVVYDNVLDLNLSREANRPTHDE
jgi:two-component system, NarL family, nitrate/nitrite response regulator NarL